jgi:hypothetical protein
MTLSQSHDGTCPLCADTSGVVWLTRENVPVHQNRVWATPAEARACPRGDLVLARCRQCGFVWNTAFDPERLPYDSDYDNRQSCSVAFRAYMAEIVDDLARRGALVGSTVLEIGCGKGDFLHLLLRAGASRAVGVDATYQGPLEDLDGRLSFRREHVRGALPGLAPQLVVSRHVIEHVALPLELLAAMRAQMQALPEAVAFIETPTVRWILEGGVFWDLFYEHCSYFDTTTLPWACQRAGLQPEAVQLAFEGQYQWVVARSGEDAVEPAILAEPGVTARLVEEFVGRAERLQERISLIFAEWAGRPGGLAVWGAAAKGATLLHLMDPSGDAVRCAIDLNPDKQGRFLPATGHAIVALESLLRDPPAAILLLNENYRRENAALMAELRLAMPLLGIEEGASLPERSVG